VELHTFQLKKEWVQTRRQQIRHEANEVVQMVLPVVNDGPGSSDRDSFPVGLLQRRWWNE
jgi:hypothetical protein